MAINVDTPAQASIGKALEVSSPQLTRAWTRAFVAVLVGVQVAWTAILGYAAYRFIETVGGLL